MGRGPPRAIPSRLVSDLGRTENVASIGGRHHTMVRQHNSFCHIACYSFSERIPGYGTTNSRPWYDEFPAMVRDHGEIERVRTDGGGEFVCRHDAFRLVYICSLIKTNLISRGAQDSSNGVDEHCLELVLGTCLAASFQALRLVVVGETRERSN